MGEWNSRPKAIRPVSLRSSIEDARNPGPSGKQSPRHLREPAHAPDVGLFFMIPGNGDTLRVSGTGRLVRDSTLQARLSVKGKEPNLV